MEKFDYLNQLICLSDIPKERIYEDPVTHKKWISIVAGRRREPDKKGNTYAVYMRQTQKEKDNKTKSYIGFGKEFSFQSNSPTIESVEDMPIAQNIDDLPY